MKKSIQSLGIVITKVPTVAPMVHLDHSLDVCPRESSSAHCIDTSIFMFVAVLFTSAEIGTKLRCLLTDA